MDKTIRPHNCKVSICNNNDSIQLRFTHGKKRQNINLGLPYIPENLAIASQKAYEIDRDIKSGILKDKAHYRIFPRVSEPSVISSHKDDEWNLLDILNFYDQMKNLDPRVTELVNDLRDWLERSPRDIITLNKADQWLHYLRNEIPHKNGKGHGYSDTNIATKWRILKASVNFAIALNKIQSNNTLVPLYKTLSKKQKEIRSYTPEQINEIITAFRDNRFTHKLSQTKDSFYADFIEFRFLTGCRPSEAIALTPSDIISRNNRTFVLFNKRYVNGHLKEGLKNGKPYRLFPVNEKLQTLIDRLPKHGKLLFTNPSGNYIDTSKVGNRFWNKVVNNLIAEGKLPFHIPFYDERHCFGSIVARQTNDIKTLANIMGNSPQTLYKNYLADDLEFEVPIF